MLIVITVDCTIMASPRIFFWHLLELGKPAIRLNVDLQKVCTFVVLFGHNVELSYNRVRGIDGRCFMR